MRLVGGLYSGIYRTIGHVHNMKACMNACCDEKECTVAYMERGVCYAMKCLDKELCKSTIAGSNSSVGYVTRDEWSLFKTAHDAVTDTELAEGVHNVHPSNITTPGKQSTDNTNVTRPTPLGIPGPETSHGTDVGYCEKGETLKNHRLMGGMKAGVFRDRGEVENIETCSEYCCRDKECHLAYMVDKSCYSVKCFNSELCETFNAPHFFLNPVMSFVSRIRNKTGEFEMFGPRGEYFFRLFFVFSVRINSSIFSMPHYLVLNVDKTYFAIDCLSGSPADLWHLIYAVCSNDLIIV